MNKPVVIEMDAYTDKFAQDRIDYLRWSDPQVRFQKYSKEDKYVARVGMPGHYVYVYLPGNGVQK